ncbi:MAG: peptidase domain-containing ABC transporter, partial [Planctomycetales bacterium]|nr:peptidase domain-containing ABC transporter [Planctomycetales bacterium]
MFRRYSLVRQNDQSDCGAAALATVAMHHGLSVGLQTMRDLGGTDRVGTNLLGLLTAAERLGFEAKAVKAPWQSMGDVPLPAIAHVTNDDGLGHFVVVHRVKKNAVVLADPASGIVTMSREQFCGIWTGYLLLLVPDQSRGLTQVNEKSVGPFRRFLSLLSDDKSLLGEAFACAVVMTLLGMTTSYFIQHLIDNVLARGETQLLNAIGVAMLLTILFRTLLGLVRRYLLAHIGRKIDLTLISTYTSHILRLPAQFFEMRQVGEILSRVHDVSKIQSAISGTTLTILVDGVMVFLSVGVLWAYDQQLAMIATLFVPLLIGSVVLHQPAIKRRSRAAMEQSARFSAHLVESISGVDTIKAFGLERQRSEDSQSRLLQTVQANFGLQMLDLSMSSAGMFVTAVASIVVLWYGGHRVVAGELTVGELMFFSSLLAYMLDPLERLAGVNLQIQDALVAMNRFTEITDLPVESIGDRHAIPMTGITKSLRIDGVSFRYGCRGNVLENVTLEVPAGKKVAIVGESGSGKSTLL